MSLVKYKYNRAVIVKKIRDIIENNSDVVLQYLYLNETQAGYCLVGKITNKKSIAKRVEKPLRELLNSSASRELGDGTVINGIITVKLYDSEFKDKVVQLALIKCGMVQSNCIVNKCKWL